MKMKSNLDFLFLLEHEDREGASIKGILLRNRVIVWVYKFVYKTNEGMRVSEEFTSGISQEK